MKYLYIHGGFGKTGTTSIQKYLFNNRELLLSKYNVFYPVLNQTPFNHYKFVSAANTIDITKWEKVKRCLDGKSPDSIILSDESLSGMPNWSFSENCFNAIKSTFPDYIIKFIIYLRREDDRLKSYYKQFLTLDRNIDYIPYYDSWLRHSSEAEKNFQALPEKIRFLRKLLGEENVIFRFYDKAKLGDGGVVSDFMGVLGLPFPLDDPGEVPSLRENLSIPTEAIPYLFFLCQKTSDSGAQARHELRKMVYECFNGKTDGKTSYFDDQDVWSLINEVDELCPGYKSIYGDKPVDWGFKDINSDPGQVLTVAMLFRVYQMLEAQERRQAKSLKMIVSSLWNQFKNILRKVLSRIV